MIRFGRIGRRLLGWFLIVALIPLLFMGYQGYYSARKAIESEAFLHMEAVAMTKVSQIRLWFSERITDLSMTAANPHLIAALTDTTLSTAERIAKIESELNFQSMRGSAYDHFCLYDGHGQPILCTRGNQDFLQAFDESELFKSACSTATPILSPIHLHEQIGPVVQVASRILNSDGSIAGVLVATLGLSETLNPIILDTTGLGETGEAYLVNENKVMLTPSRFMNHPAALTHTMDTEGIRKALTGVKGAGIYRSWNGQNMVLGSWAYIPEQKWALIAEIHTDEAFAMLSQLRRNAIVVALLTLGAILVVVVLVSRSISDPIQNLAAASLDISSGNLDRRVTVKLRDEFGELAERFNAMVQSLQSSRKSEHEAYESLVRAQQELMQSEKLAAIGELAAGVVHEIRNPLSSVKMNLQILEKAYGESDELTPHFRLARSQIERLEDMLTELLDFSKPIPLELKAVPISALINEAVATFQASKDCDKIRINIENQTDRLFVKADQQKILQVLLNVLLNAGQAVENNGNIRIAVERTAANGFIKILVHDNGKGISPPQLARVFEPFFTTKSNGTGLGLPLAKRIIQAHGGEMRIESAVGEGTTVSIFLQEATA